ncbi:HAMP domain-containing histidine kinase [Campylobacter sp. RM9344]|uniref:histidine kinase n=1 Tax=Campylobacter californiensis TaxID=1032243 RepID=A0AAW3ZU90_9BACT|nr:MULTISPECIES: ArsS family sensor histidine kinase [unclassified Campylobacter]MBE2985136.1 HAMP domain-containing histidine kinase [Campylobacter sp. RM6883]MBE2986425.1 HAMP domain-containing histidine kinase [Campylobacter sp. RM12919]MBE2988703.1 HAMP domain-containing histidine kinase [Campylobacter sp. RM12920]MBE2995726.1 HAMP domain-containing histidine kinase [Campylobacter sp. RM6913]MBE3022824.1 HAMP domain-containing histidine kinase [Campylobacter sp. 7477a]MBE3030011.1 HAMP do
MKYSITTKITIIFAIAFSLMCLLFLTFANIQRDNAVDKLRSKQVSAISYLLTLYERANPPKDLEHYFKNFGLEYVGNKNLANAVVDNGEHIFARHTPLGLVQSILYKNDLYLLIKNPSFQLLLESNDVRHVNDPLWMGFFVISALLISLYVSVLKSLLPLKKLSKDIRRFAAGNMDTVICPLPNAKAQDEISQVALEFDNAVCKIRELIRSRQLFLRAIMHELKTPIGKGRIVSEMVSNDTQKSRLINVFERLEMLINEFSKVEQLLSKSYALNYQECHFSLILEQVEDMLMLDKFHEKVTCEIKEDMLLRVDFQLFSLAIKNLIDNALKYANDKKAIVICESNRITVKNLGNPLAHPIEHYMQAFVRGDKNTSAGMGLGLYIIEQICQMQKFELNYAYEDGYHCFKISPSTTKK